MEMKYIKIQNSCASAIIALQGAHIFNYTRKDDSDSILWLSNESYFEPKKAIRGGIPICWPWFGVHQDTALPQHGFARICMFEHISTDEVNERTTQITLRLRDSKETLSMWEYKFELDVKITISDELSVELITKNIDSKAFKITQALHTYFNVSDISETRVIGLDGTKYFNALNNTTGIQDGDILFTEEFDKVYTSKDSELVLLDANHALDIKNEGSNSVVIWNPWIEKCSRMSAMHKDAYKEFVCIESANALDDYIILNPEESHKLKVTIR